MIVDCTVCNIELPRKDLPHHLSENAQHHIKLLQDKFVEQEENNRHLMKKIAKLQKSLFFYQMLSDKIKPSLRYSPMEQLPVLLPLAFVQTDSNSPVRVVEGTRVVYKDAPFFSSQCQPVMIRANNYVMNIKRLYYFEITVKNHGHNRAFGLGLSALPNVCCEGLPGWLKDTFGYHSDDGRVFGNGCNSAGIPYGPTYGAGDVVGCGWDQIEQTIFFTRNGDFLGIAFRGIKYPHLFPIVGLQAFSCCIDANFGTHPFKFDMKKIVSDKHFAPLTVV